MVSQALYRKYRSKSLDEIVGQDHITGILKRAIANGKIAHAYLLTGPRGVGKTSIARILAHEINQLPYTDDSTNLDIIEIDAASNNSVEDIRDLREKARIAPVAATKKIYIIDEVHMLSKAAFNALLKTLEEPPEHIVFILATTDSDKLPATIISRVQRFNFRSISEADAIRHLTAIAKKEKIAISPDAIALIAAHGRGSFRDSISLLDQLQSLSDGMIERDAVEGILGLAEGDAIQALLYAYDHADISQIVSLLDEADSRGIPAHIIAEQLIRTIRGSIASTPQYLPLLDRLLDVTRSAWPHVKLLTALAEHVPQTPALGALPVAAPAVVDEKPKAVVKQKPAEKPVTPVKEAPKPQPEAKPEPKPAETKAKAAASITVDDTVWNAFLTELKAKEHSGAVAILSGCGYGSEGSVLTIFAGRKFNKTRLDKDIAGLSAALAAVGVDAEIVITEGKKPPKDSETAAIVAMMGGGEEINA
jgi:DNA polymerase-3 subunit gamma/tau